MEDNIIKLTKLVENLERDVHSVKKLLSEIEKIGKPNYKELPGIVGVFDGFYLIPENGEKIEVPQNYSAKSRLVYGDTLKVIEEDGKKLFKQIAKVPRKSVEGVVNKKEGKWYVLADTGSYRLNDAAVEFHNLNINDKIIINIPANNTGVPFATLEKAPERVIKEFVKSNKVEEVKKIEPKFEPKVVVKKLSKPVTRHVQVVKKDAKTETSKEAAPKAVKPKVETPKVGKEFLDQLVLGDDDLR